MATGLFAIHKRMLYSVLFKSSLMKDTSLDVYSLIPKREGPLVG